jgi:hypothetical protein
LTKSKRPRANPALRLAFIRQCHVYLSVFVAPSLLFFAFTGALQTFRIPDDKAAPALIQKLARVHKDDVFALKPVRPKRPEAAGPAKAGRPPEAKPREPASTTALKWFFTAISIGVGLTTLLGLWMALTHNRRKLMVWLALLAGAAAPILILTLL